MAYDTRLFQEAQKISFGCQTWPYTNSCISLKVIIELFLKSWTYSYWFQTQKIICLTLKVKTRQLEENTNSTSDARAEEAVPRLYGSTESKVSIRSTEHLGKSLKVSHKQLSYGCCGLNNVAWGSFDFFQ